MHITLKDAVVVLPNRAPYFTEVIGFGRDCPNRRVHKDAHRVPAS